MWVAVWLALISGAHAQTAHTKINQHGGSYEWGWQLTPQGDGTAGHYYVKLPQSEQQVRYVADSNGHHSAVSVRSGSHGTSGGAHETSAGAHTSTGAHSAGSNTYSASITTAPSAQQQSNTQLYQVTSNGTQGDRGVTGQPLEIYLLQPQFSSPGHQLLTIQPQQYPTPNFYYNNNVLTTPAQYSIQTLHPIQLNDQINDYKQSNEETNEETIESAESSKPISNKEDSRDHEHLTTNIVQVFKDHNCTNEEDSNRTPKEYNSDMQSTRQYAEEPTYNIHNINGNFGVKEGTERPLSYRGAVHFRVEPPRENARSERYYYNQPPRTETPQTTEEERISRLVASTQDIISNEDLLKINHAIEKFSNVHNDDIIKPKPRFELKTQQTRYYDSVQASTPRSRITVKAKIGNIVNSEIEHLENNQKKEEVLQTNSNQYKFASPIVVQDTYDNYKKQIVSNLVSTMVPYLQDGYEIVGVRNSIDENYTHSEYKQSSGEDLVNVTPRPISQKYLAPITVALRLFNANDTEAYNTVDDHDASDSEVVTDTVKSPVKEKTVVEIQKSIPLEITHINDIEVHDYLEEGRSSDKGPLDLAKSLYHTYVEALKSQDTYQQTQNSNNDNSDYNEKHNDARDQLEPSENIQTEVEIRPNEVSNERNEFARHYYNNYDQDQKVIQPIVIEKEVPITQYVDRFIEKKVPYPEKVEVIKHVPVDRPVPVPVPYERIVDRPVEVTRFVDKPYPVEVPHLYPVQVPYPVEHKVYVDRPIHVPYPVDRVVEKQVVHQVPVPTPVAVPVEVPVEKRVLYPVPVEKHVPYPVAVEKPVTVEKIVHRNVPVPYEVEKRVPYPVHYETKVPVPYPVEKIVPVPVERIVEKPVTITKVVEKPVHIEVPVPVHVPQPYPVDRIVEKKVPYPVPVDRIVEKKVHVKVPYPVDRVVEKIVEKPVVVTKYVDKPYPVETRVPYQEEKNVERRPYHIEVPVGGRNPYPTEKNVEKQVYVPIRVPYQFEKPQDYYSYGYQRQQTQNAPIYQKYTVEQHKQWIPPPHFNINEVRNDQKPQIVLHNQQVDQGQNPNNKVQTTHWGNYYASSYQYINNTPKYDLKNIRKSPELANYIQYITNNQQRSQKENEYYGPPPLVQNDNHWEENKNYLVEVKLRRTDRTPKVSKLRIEYGFKPPLIPSTEVDLDGIPIKKD
ncbi:uncharacterized protein [Choristoneura fumiferana]|uniref:uncharacterized protein n=1 Tax=Choristoneura fumiferana TaxID=7141 RepID=UPI003D1577CC